jgi:predicted transposase YbfD/YdcC
MKDKPTATLSDHFGSLEDPRIDRTKRHALLDIIVSAISAVICGADVWLEVELFGNAKLVDYRRNRAGWRNLLTIVKVVAERRVNGETTFDGRHFISSLDGDARHMLRAVRSHWGNENALPEVVEHSGRDRGRSEPSASPAPGRGRQAFGGDRAATPPAPGSGRRWPSPPWPARRRARSTVKRLPPTSPAQSAGRPLRPAECAAQS